MSKREPKRLPHDFHLWTAVAETVEPLRRKRVAQPHGAPPLPLPPETAPSPEIRLPPASRPARREPFLPPYQAPSQQRKAPDKAVDPATHRKVRRGRIEIDGTIDLHGMTQAEAREALHRFVLARAARGDRTLLVITGKGTRNDDDFIAAMNERGVLRTMLPVWLNEPGLARHVSGWSLAARGHGGEGAWYVRLRRA